jgi:hypothetical protein
MSGLLELITRTKGIEYLLALGFLFSFVGFWQWQQYRGNRLVVRLAPLAVVALIFAIGASMVIASPATATPRAQEFPNVEKEHYLANAYGPAKFAAHEMSPNVISCQTCHHHSTNGTIQACSTCHNEPFDGTASDKPGLKAAFHQRCAECHQSAFAGPMTCTNCHSENPDEANLKKDSPSAVTPPAIAHPLLDQYGDCFACHRAGGPLPLAENHSGYRANVECLGCHKPSTGNLTASTIQAVQKKDVQQAPVQPVQQPAAAAQPAPAPAAQPAAAPAAGSPSPLSHPVAGREACTTCHQVNGGMKPMPAAHAGRTDPTCLACHKAS